MIPSGAPSPSLFLLISGLKQCTPLLGRTLTTDHGFKERVREDMLVRLLDDFAWRNSERRALAELHNVVPPPLPFTYVPGMNVIAAPFLYTLLSELEAFFCLRGSSSSVVRRSYTTLHLNLLAELFIDDTSNSGCRNGARE